MNNLNLISNFAEFKELKNIDKSTMIGVLEDVFRHALQKQYGTDENFDVIINADKGDLEIWRNRVVVADEEFEDDVRQISLSQIQAIDSSYEVGDEYTGGKIYDPGNGKTYNCSMKVEGDVLKVRGSLDKRGLIGRTMDWFRVK